MRNYDGRAYVCSIKTERDAFGNGEHDLWQAFLLAPKASEKSTHWTELTVPLSQFMKTYKGGVVESQTIGGKDSLRRRGNMRTIGIACGGLESGKGDMDGRVSIGGEENRTCWTKRERGRFEDGEN